VDVAITHEGEGTVRHYANAALFPKHDTSQV
jgi:hypothetical protein